MKLQRIPRTFLKTIHSGSKNIPTLYFHPNPLISGLFYKRLETILTLIPEKLKKKDRIVCDFGGGGGVFLPTLSKIFKEVFVIDLETYEAEAIVKKYNLKNIKIFQKDVLADVVPENYFDIIIAADTLEHFKDLKDPIEKIYRLLKKKGLLFVSSPTENLFYRFGRKLAGLEKPVDHYHNTKDIEQTLREEFFDITKRRYLPFRIFCLSLFIISMAEKKNP